MVSIRLTRPSDAVLSGLMERCRDEPFTYEPVGITGLSAAPSGYRRDHWRRPIGRGDDAFVRACHALAQWQVHRGAGLAVVTDGPPAPGRVVAMSAPLSLGFIDAVCRVIDAEESTDRCGFTYGTLSVHPEQGEEAFTVLRTADGEVVFEIVAVSRPQQLLAKLGAPIARRLQRAATERYFSAMTSAANG